jgi:hypothetical protein
MDGIVGRQWNFTFEILSGFFNLPLVSSPYSATVLGTNESSVHLHLHFPSLRLEGEGEGEGEITRVHNHYRS